MAKLFASLLFIEVMPLLVGSSSPDSCAATSSSACTNRALLQHAGVKSSKAVSMSAGPEEDFAAAQASVAGGAARAAVASFELPQHLYDEGLKVLGSEETLDLVVAATRLETQARLYANENITFRIVSGDAVDADDVYGLESLGQLEGNVSGMMNMIDLGGNYGRVTIAAFKKVPEKMRIIVVEPVPSTYLLLRWNLWLNHIPELTKEEWEANPQMPGVLALQNGMTSVDGQTTGLCYTPPFTMNARTCDCSDGGDVDSPEQGVTGCYPVVGRTIESLIGMFGSEPITFLKMDCEGCEEDVVPQLSKMAALNIVRFGGELHATSNQMEEFACRFDGGRWFVHVCLVNGNSYETLNLPERCENAYRASCSDKGQ